MKTYHYMENDFRVLVHYDNERGQLYCFSGPVNNMLEIPSEMTVTVCGLSDSGVRSFIEAYFPMIEEKLIEPILHELGIPPRMKSII